MTKQEYFGDWWKIIDEGELDRVMSKIAPLYSIKPITPGIKDVFRAFEFCSRKNCKVVILGQDPYPQPNIATGIAFGNQKDTKELSPSLKILKNAMINLEIPHNSCIFDASLESIATQGVLFLNSSLTVEVNKINSHQLLWRSFMEKFLKNLCKVETGLIFVLMGANAQSFESCLGKYNYVIKCVHPAYCVRNNISFPNIFSEINQRLELQYGRTIKWFN